MMTQRTFEGGARLAALMLAAAGAMALAGCEEHGYPSAAPTAAPEEGEAALAGAPTTTRTPQYVPPPGAAPYGPAYGPQAPGAYGPETPPPPPPPPVNPYAAAPRPYGPPPGYPPAASVPPEVVTMAPIPNPPEQPYGYSPRRHHAWRGGEWAPPPAAYAWRRRHHHVRHLHPVHAPPSAIRHHPAAAWAPPPPRGAMSARHAPPTSGHAAPVAPGGQLPKPVAPEHHRRHHGAAAAAAGAGAASGAAANSAADANATSNTTTASEADRYQAFGQALKEAFANTAELKAPAHMEANQPATVTLTLPADFAQTVKTEATKQNLADAAAMVNLVASLSGDGYTIVPDQPQTMALTLGQSTSNVFTWKVTPTGAGRAALKTAVRAQMVGDGHVIDLGTKSTGSGGATGRVVGIGLLALIALILLGWAAQRRRPAPVGAVKPRVANFDTTPRP